MGPQIGFARRIFSVMAPMTGALRRRILVVGMTPVPVMVPMVVPPLGPRSHVRWLLIAGVALWARDLFDHVSHGVEANRPDSGAD